MTILGADGEALTAEKPVEEVAEEPKEPPFYAIEERIFFSQYGQQVIEREVVAGEAPEGHHRFWGVCREHTFHLPGGKKLKVNNIEFPIEIEGEELGPGMQVDYKAVLPKVYEQFKPQMDEKAPKIAERMVIRQHQAAERSNKAIGRYTPEQLQKVDEIKRNGPCPCGSGNKYKQCCLGKNS